MEVVQQRDRIDSRENDRPHGPFGMKRRGVVNATAAATAAAVAAAAIAAAAIAAAATAAAATASSWRHSVQKEMSEGGDGGVIGGERVGFRYGPGHRLLIRQHGASPEKEQGDPIASPPYSMDGMGGQNRSIP